MTTDDTLHGPPAPRDVNALDAAIFAVNTMCHPEASSAEDVRYVIDHADEIIGALVDLRIVEAKS